MCSRILEFHFTFDLRNYREISKEDYCRIKEGTKTSYRTLLVVLLRYMREILISACWKLFDPQLSSTSVAVASFPIAPNFLLSREMNDKRRPDPSAKSTPKSFRRISAFFFVEICYSKCEKIQFLHGAELERRND